MNFANPSIYFGGNNAYLDVDNMFGYGPENIRILSIPQKMRVRCFVNYYSGRMPLHVTVRYYDRTNRLVRKFEKNFSAYDMMPTAHFNNKSWVVGEFFIEP